MNYWNRSLARVLLGGALLVASPAWAALNCTLSVAPAPVQGIYQWASDLDLQGSFSVTCTRSLADPRRHDLWIGLDQPAGGLSMPRDIGGGSLNYTIYRRRFGSGVWTNSGAERANSSAAGALSAYIRFGNNSTVESDTFDFYLRVPAWQILSPAGVYLSVPVAVTLRESDASGVVLGSGSVSARISIPNHCRFSTDPAPVAVGYPAFSPVPIVRTSGFALTCTQGTNYTLALDAGVGVVPGVEINYSAALSASSSTGTATAQGYDVTFTFPAGQAGRCSGASCMGTGTRTITVTY